MGFAARTKGERERSTRQGKRKSKGKECGPKKSSRNRNVVHEIRWGWKVVPKNVVLGNVVPSIKEK